MADVKDAPSLKLMSFPNVKIAKPDQQFIHSTLGFSYLVVCLDMDAAVGAPQKQKLSSLTDSRKG